MRIPPSASEPESGSVIAQAPILSSVMRSSAQRSICAGVPSLLIVPAARPLDTPSEVRRPGLTRHSSIVEISCAAGSDVAALARRLLTGELSLELAREALLRHLLQTEGVVHLSQDRVGRQSVVLEVIELGPDLLVDETPHDGDDRLLLVGPLVHLATRTLPNEPVRSYQEVTGEDGEEEFKRWSINVVVHWDCPTATITGARQSHGSAWNSATKSSISIASEPTRRSG